MAFQDLRYRGMQKSKALLRQEGWKGDVKSGVLWMIDNGLTAPEICDKLQISRDTLWRWVQMWEEQDAKPTSELTAA